MASYHNVAIFWDYENCHPGSGVTGYDVANAIRKISHRYGVLKQFKAYFELAEQPSSKSSTLRSELQSSGVSLTDCPHNGRKDVADKMILVDMLAFALDNEAPATAILISGDRDFAYAISILRNRRYQVVLIAPSTAHVSLRSQATTVFDWNIHVLDSCALKTPDLGFSQSEKDAKAVQTRCSPPLGPPQFNPKALQRRSSFELGTFPRPPGSSFIRNSDRGQNTSPEDAKLPKAPLGRSFVNSDVVPNAGSAAIRTAAREADRASAQVHSNTPLQNLSPSKLSWRQLARPESCEANSASLDWPMKPDGIDSQDSSASPTVVQRSELSSVLPTDKTELPMGKPSFSTTTGTPTEMRFPRRGSSIASYSSNGTASSARAGVGAAEQSEFSPFFGLARVAKPPSPILPKSVAFSMEDSPLPTKSPLLQPDAALSYDAQLPNDIPSPPSPSLESSHDGEQDDTGTNDVSPNFLPLIEELERLQSSRSVTPLRSVVGQALLARNASVYKEVGVTNFSRYVTLAQQAGIITLGGVSGKAWISLR